MELKDKRVLITGGAAGLGLAMAHAFAAAGARVIVADIRQDILDLAVAQIQAAGGQAAGIAVNVAEEASVEALAKKIVADFGGLDVAVLNAGILRDGLLIKTDKATGKVSAKMSLAQWQSVIDVNLTGVFLTGRESAAIMAEQGTGGVIIPIASVAMHGNPGQSNYSAAKAGVGALAKLWAHELARYKVRVAAIAPGFIATEMVLKDMKPEALEMWQKKIPIGRLGAPQEIAQTALFIAQNELITGVVIEASGGIKI